MNTTRHVNNLINIFFKRVCPIMPCSMSYKWGYWYKK